MFDELDSKLGAAYKLSIMYEFGVADLTESTDIELPEFYCC